MKSRGGRKPSSVRFALIVLPIWLATAGWLWGWWFAQAPQSHLALFLPLTAALFYEYTIVPSALLYYTLRARIPAGRRPQKDLKVAVITLCVPSHESLDVIERQLKAMVRIKYPHDSWILDEGNDKDIRKLARKHGVRYFTRKNIEKYNQPAYPFQAKTKSGNVNAWLDKTKRYNYDFFVQLDIDHTPRPDYLHKTLGHFRDSSTGWVQAPSVYNNMSFWTARGAAEQDMGMQGPIQMGLYGSEGTPIIIGSHCTYRTAAIREIDGFQPTRAEDHLDTLALVANGWKGVFVPVAIAKGEGPETLPAYLSQQYAWARSMFQILIGAGHHHLRKMPFRLRLHFLFFETWYPLCAGAFLTLFLIPIFSVLLNASPIRASLEQFAVHLVPFIIAMILLVYASKPLMQPVGTPLSWRGVLLHLVRWPVVVTAIVGVLMRRQKPYQITPKGKFLENAPTLKLYRPFLFLGALSAAAVLYAGIRENTNALAGQEFFAAYAAGTMLGVCMVDLHLRLRQTHLKHREFRKLWLKPVVAVFAATTITASIITFALIVPLGNVMAAPFEQTSQWSTDRVAHTLKTAVGALNR